MQEHILVIDDEPKITDFLKRGLAYEGYRVSVGANGHEGLQIALHHVPDLVILDIMLPGIDGLEVCRRLREGGGDMPIIMLTAKESIPDRVKGLESGADDYLVKPFALAELVARVRALLRRAKSENSEKLRYAELHLDPSTRQVWRGERELDLTTKEFDLLEIFMRHPQQVLSRGIILDQIWGYDFGGESNIIDVYVRYLRSKMEAQGEPRLIQTIRGVGYALREP